MFVPPQHRAEIEKLSKDVLMDMVWDYAGQIAGSEDDQHIMTEFRQRRDIILVYHANAKSNT